MTPLAEQRRIVAKVVPLLASVDALETQLGTSRATAATRPGEAGDCCAPQMIELN
jgi:hypothetical protein